MTYLEIRKELNLTLKQFKQKLILLGLDFKENYSKEEFLKIQDFQNKNLSKSEQREISYIKEGWIPVRNLAFNCSKNTLKSYFKKLGIVPYKPIHQLSFISQIDFEKIENFFKDNSNKKERKIKICQETSLARYGVKNPSQTKESKKKITEKNTKNAKDRLTKAKITNLKRYGTENPFSSELIKKKIVDTNVKKYGYAYTLQNPNFRKKIFSKQMTSPEKKMYEMLKNRGFIFEYQYTCNNKSFDFAVFNADYSLNTLIEIDGLFFHGLLQDSDGKHQRGEKDNERFLKVPENVKYLVCDENKIEQCFIQLCANFNISYNEWIDSVIDNLPKDFPYYTFSEKRMKKDYETLKKSEYNKNSLVGMSIINNFHKSIYHSKRQGKPSPFEAWKNKELLKRCVKNRFIYSSSLSSHSILQGFNICKLAPKVSVFNPLLAKYLIKKYLNDFDTIFDPFSGFSGRMLGAVSLGKKYIGQDINKTTIEESLLICNFLNIDISLTVKNVFEDNFKSFDCLFTCSPYRLKETWGMEIEDLECDEWIKICMEKYKCKKYLFVVDSTVKFKNCIVETISNNSHFNNNNEFVVLINGADV